MARNMTQGSITGHLLVYAVPLVFGNLFQQLYHTVDSVVVGQFNGKEALAAIGAAGPIMNILIFLFFPQVLPAYFPEVSAHPSAFSSPLQSFL